MSFKCDENIDNFLVRSSFQTKDQSGTFKCTRARRKTFPFIHSAEKISALNARHFKLSNHSEQKMAIYGLFLNLGSSESRKTLEQQLIFQIGTLIPIGINERFLFY